MKLSELGIPLESLAGVGKSKASLFSRLNIFTVGDLLGTYPRDWEDRTKLCTLNQYAQNYGKVHTVCKVLAHDFFGYGKMKTLKIAVTDGTANAFLVAFNRPFLQKSLPEGSIISVTGKFELRYNTLQASSFEAERLAYSGQLEDWQDKPIPGSGVLPVYPLTEGITQKIYRKIVASALQQYGKSLEDDLPALIIQERKLLHKAQALSFIHQPKDIREVLLAKRSLIYEELYFFEYKMAQHTLRHRGSLPSLEQVSAFEASAPDSASSAKGSASASSNISANKECGAQEGIPNAASYFSTPDVSKSEFLESLSPRQKQLVERLPFEFTQGQMSAIFQMNRDIDKSQDDLNTLVNKPEALERQPFSMQRLLQGDVGSGKTLVSFMICLRTIDYGGQCALMAPTELLARQHAENAASLLEALGVKVAFLTGNLKAAGRQALLNALKNGSVNFVVGTHALFSRNIQYANLQLAVIDEQHRFGVTQRESILAKGRISSSEYSHTPDLLMMSATPIPQTLALTAFGDLDVSTIRSMPKGRLPVKTYLSVMGNERNAYEAVRKELMAGHQAYFVYPRIGEEEPLEQEMPENQGNLKSAQEMFNFLSKEVYPSFKCALIHSKVEEEESRQILEDFRQNKIQVLVATTVVEVGVDVPNATCIVIEHADRFGLAELHQLRGRVGRSSLQSYCFLIYGKNITAVGIERLKALHQTNDGFAIAEEDLRLRGPGEVSGTAQSGYLTLGIADLARDKDILMQARYDAFEMLRRSS
ncbi:MAG: ATP-dependent DNA helicase RecG [Treponema sp.]|nr:ATP-dependent DNA helicase RecG [Treponema sp.]